MPTLRLGPDRHGRRLTLRHGRVVSFGEEPADGGADSLACPDTVLEPGRVNAHTHVYSGLAPLGIPAPEPPPEDFLQILERVWWRLDRALDADSLRAAARLYVAEALLAGTTTLVDHHESPRLIDGSLDLLADVCDELGIRAALCYGATERNGGADEARRGLAECRRFLAANRRPAVRGLVGLHASFTVSDETAAAAGELARELGTVCHVHLAEDVADVEDARRRGWDGPLERLLELGALPPGSIVAHAVHCDAAQVRRAAAAGLWIVQNPRSNRGNGVGYPPALAASRRVALGTDGYPARMDDERAVLLEEAARHGDDADLAAGRPPAGRRLAADLFGPDFAALEPGAAGDAVARRPDGGVEHVAVAGRLVVRSGELVAANLGGIRAEAERRAPELWRRMERIAREERRGEVR